MYPKMKKYYRTLLNVFQPVSSFCSLECLLNCKDGCWVDDLKQKVRIIPHKKATGKVLASINSSTNNKARVVSIIQAKFCKFDFLS